MPTWLKDHVEYVPWILLAILIAPIILHLCTGWLSWRKRIFGVFGAEEIRNYFRTFAKDISPDLDNSTIQKLFRKRFNSRFGARYYLLATLFLAPVAGFLIFWATSTAFSWAGVAKATPTKLPPIAVGAIAGAYMWVLSDLLRRSRNGDFRPVDIWWDNLRFVIAVPLGYTLANMMKSDFGFGLAFLLGGFPTKSLFTIIRRVGGKKLGLGTETKEAESELENLDGVDRAAAERLADEGYRTAAQLAWADPIDLIMRCPGFSYSFTIDCISQSIAYVVRDKLTDKGLKALRGAQEISYLQDALNGDEADPVQKKAKEEAEAVLDAIATNKKAKSLLVHACLEIAEDPHTKLLRDIWHPDYEEPDIDVQIQNARDRLAALLARKAKQTKSSP